MDQESLTPLNSPGTVPEQEDPGGGGLELLCLFEPCSMYQADEDVVCGDFFFFD